MALLKYRAKKPTRFLCVLSKLSYQGTGAFLLWPVQTIVPRDPTPRRFFCSLFQSIVCQGTEAFERMSPGTRVTGGPSQSERAKTGGNDGALRDPISQTGPRHVPSAGCDHGLSGLQSCLLLGIRCSASTWRKRLRLGNVIMGGWWALRTPFAIS